MGGGVGRGDRLSVLARICNPDSRTGDLGTTSRISKIAQFLRVMERSSHPLLDCQQVIIIPSAAATKSREVSKPHSRTSRAVLGLFRPSN